MHQIFSWKIWEKTMEADLKKNLWLRLQLRGHQMVINTVHLMLLLEMTIMVCETTLLSTKGLAKNSFTPSSYHG